MPQRSVSQHTVPCEGLQEIRVVHATLDARTGTLENWQEKQNGHLSEIDRNLQRLREDMNAMGQRLSGDMHGIRAALEGQITASDNQAVSRERQLILGMLFAAVAALTSLGVTVLKLVQ